MMTEHYALHRTLEQKAVVLRNVEHVLNSGHLPAPTEPQVMEDSGDLETAKMLAIALRNNPEATNAFLEENCSKHFLDEIKRLATSA